MDLLPYILGIRHRDDRTETWEEGFRQSEMWAFEEDGYFYSKYQKPFGKNPYGQYKFVEPAQLEPIFPKHGWPRSTECPFVGELAGYLLFDVWQDRRVFVEDWLRAGHGFVGRTDDGRYFDVVKEAEWPLNNAAEKHGFESGAAFLKSTPAYVRYVRTTIEQELQKLGVSAEFITHGTSHNPHRITNPHVVNLREVKFRLWTFDWTGFKSREIQDWLFLDS